MSRQEIVASSKTYRKVNAELADALGIDPGHTRSPSDDFTRLVDYVAASPSASEKELSRLAKKYYELGVRRGLRHATDLMVEGHFFVKGAKCYAEGDTALSIRVRMPDGERVQLELSFSPDNLGFSD